MACGVVGPALRRNAKFISYEFLTNSHDGTPPTAERLQRCAAGGRDTDARLDGIAGLHRRKRTQGERYAGVATVAFPGRVGRPPASTRDGGRPADGPCCGLVPDRRRRPFPQGSGLPRVDSRRDIWVVSVPSLTSWLKRWSGFQPAAQIHQLVGLVPRDRLRPVGRRRGCRGSRGNGSGPRRPPPARRWPPKRLPRQVGPLIPQVHNVISDRIAIEHHSYLVGCRCHPCDVRALTMIIALDKYFTPIVLRRWRASRGVARQTINTPERIGPSRARRHPHRSELARAAGRTADASA